MTHDQANQAFADLVQSMHDKRDEAFERRLLNALSAVCRRSSHISQTIEGDAGRPLVGPDAAPGCADKGNDIGSGEGGGPIA